LKIELLGKVLGTDGMRAKKDVLVIEVHFFSGDESKLNTVSISQNSLDQPS